MFLSSSILHQKKISRGSKGRAAVCCRGNGKTWCTRFQKVSEAVVKFSIRFEARPAAAAAFKGEFSTFGTKDIRTVERGMPTAALGGGEGTRAKAS